MSVLARVVLVACLGGLACGQRGAPSSGPPPADATKAAPAVAAADAAPAKPKRSREELVEAALARVPAVTTEVARLRGLDAKPVVAAYQSSEDFKTFLRGQLALELPPAKSLAVSRALHHLGLLKERIDLGAVLEAALLSQAGAYYDPETKKFYIVMVPDSELMLDTLSSHELMHAVQDQHFDLLTYLGGKGNKAGLSEDQITARRFVVEGEASLLMMAFMGAKMGGGKDPFAPGQVEALGLQLKMTAGMDARAMAGMAKAQGGALSELGPDFKAALDALETIPPAVLVPLYDAYFKGALTVFEAHRAGGWAAVATLYTKPPASTEQVLHPAEKLVATRDEPTPVKLPVPKDFGAWTKLHEETLGELLWQVYFSLWGVDAKTGAAAAAGWDGDRVSVWARGDDTIGLVSTVWDTLAEAEEFERAITPTLAARGVMGGVRRVGQRVHVVTGCPRVTCDALLGQLGTIGGPIVP